MNRKECDCCIKYKTIYCPNSSECYSLGNLPNFKTKLDILKENDTLNKGIDELIKKYEDEKETSLKTSEETKQKSLRARIRERKIVYWVISLRKDEKANVLDKIIQDLKKLKGE